MARWIIEYLAKNSKTAADVDIESTMDHFTPYMVAVIQEHFEIADLLLKHGLANQNYQNIEGLTIQDKALYMNKARVLHYLDGRLPASNSIKSRPRRQSGSMDING